MNLFLQIREAFANLTSAKLRSFLAVLGILVGTGSVVAMVSGGQLATLEALKQFEQLGTDLLSISLYSESGGDEDASRKPRDMTLEDVYRMQKKVPGIKAIAPYTSSYESLSYEGKTISGSIIGATDSLKKVINIDITEGRFISVLDRYSYFCVIGDKIRQELRKNGVVNPVGMQIQVGEYYFTIVGVAAPWIENSFFNQDVNESIIIPLETVSILSKYAKINNLVLRLDPDADIDKIQDDITAYMHTILPSYKLFFRSAKQLIQSMTDQRQTLTLLLALIGSISLIVGGIGVMNIMLVSVVERKREIGIRMAVGARRRDIQVLFLVEAVALTLFGGIMGVIIGILASYIMALFAGWSFTVFMLPPTIGFVVSVAIGIFFGFYPAYSASQLDIIDTLRSD